MDLNKKELKKIMHSFNCISSRMMRVNYDEYNMVLKKFIYYIEDNPIILDYINQGSDNSYDAAADWELVAHKEGYMFSFGPSSEEESFQIYSILKHIAENTELPYYDFRNIYGKQKWQDNVKEFNDRVLLVLINNINDYLTGLGIDMGLDENTVWNVNGGQVNYARDGATITAEQNNGVLKDELEKIMDAIKCNLSEIEQDDAETIIDSAEMIKEEIMKPEPKKKIISNGIKLLTPMITIANGIPTLAMNIQKFIEFVTPYIH